MIRTGDTTEEEEEEDTRDSHDGSGDVVDINGDGAGEGSDVASVEVVGGNDKSAIYIAIACIGLFVTAMCAICGYWYFLKPGMKAKSVMISSTEIPTKLKGKKYRDHTQLCGMDDDLEDGVLNISPQTSGGYDMSPLQHDETDHDLDEGDDDEDEDEDVEHEQHDILEDPEEDGAFMTGATR